MGIEVGSPSGSGVAAHALVNDAAGDDQHAEEDGYMGRVAIRACSVHGEIDEQTQSQQDETKAGERGHATTMS
jgi:hypothetical protein